MNYIEWFEAHAQKHRHIVDKLLQQGYARDAIIDYFDFDKMRLQEPDFCPLYATNTQCHETETLNCYFCACPHFRFNDNPTEAPDGHHYYSHCAINATEGAQFQTRSAIHQDCSNCLLPHSARFIRTLFDTDWCQVMRHCNLKP